MIRKLSAVAVVLLLAAAPTFAYVLDDFNDNVTDTTLWTVGYNSQMTVAESNQRVEMMVPSTLTGGHGVTYDSLFALRGDFDIRVRYLLLDWPQNSGVRVGLVAFSTTSWYTMERTGADNGDPSKGPTWNYEHYVTNLRELGLTSQSTNALSGWLRFVRAGSLLTASFYDDDISQWTDLASRPVSTDDCPVSLCAWSDSNYFGHAYTRVAFDDFEVDDGQLVFVPEPSNLLALIVGIAGVGSGMMRRRRA